MGDKSAIEWTDATWNVVTGCSKVSQGCKHCYAERIWPRVYGDRPFTDVKFHEDRLDLPLRWKSPRRIFVNSLSDLFHEKVSDQQLTDIFGIMALAHWHVFQVLTKRPERMCEYLSQGDHGIIAQFYAVQSGGGMGPRAMFRALDIKRRDAIPWQWPLPNVWLGVSCEDQETANHRIAYLLNTPANVRWVSAEPLLGPIDFSRVFAYQKWVVTPSRGDFKSHPGDYGAPLDWIVVGGESGPKARPMHPAWARTIRDQCIEAKVPFFFKQWGNWIGSGQVVDYPVRDKKLFTFPDGQIVSRFDKKTTGRLLDGEEWSQYPA